MQGLLWPLALLGLVAFAHASDVQGLDAYRRAAAAGEVGSVTGRAYAEPRRTSEAGPAITGTTVSIVPRSSAFLGRLAELREAARTDARAQATAAASLGAAQAQYESEVWAEGGDEFVRVTHVDERGHYTVGALPAGQWVLVARHAAFVERTSRAGKKKEQETFILQPRLVGFYSVDVWVREFAVSPGRETRVDLTDRGIWFSGIEEKRRGAGR